MSLTTEYQANYDALMALPLVQSLIKKNKKLSKRNKALKNLIYSLPEFRTNNRQCCCAAADLPNRNNKCINTDDVIIKTEKGSCVQEVSSGNICDLDVVIVETNNVTNKQNINYEIEEEAEEEEEEVFEIEIDDKTYYTNNEENGIIYEALPNDEVGDKIGYLKDGEPFFTNIV